MSLHVYLDFYTRAQKLDTTISQLKRHPFFSITFLPKNVFLLINEKTRPKEV